MSGPPTAMFHRATDVDIEDSKLTNSGRDTTYNVQNNYIRVARGLVVPDAVSYIKTAVQYFVPWTNRSTGVDGVDPLPQEAAATEHNLQSSTSDPVEISDVVPSDPLSLPVTSIADRYTRSMLECLAGYPLYDPKPFSELSKESYSRKGVNVGDVGFVRKDGTFDFLFNICPPQNNSINPPSLPDGFSLETPDHSATINLEPLPRNTCLFPQTVTKTASGEYTCERSGGAILVLPEGAVKDEALNIGWFEDLAKNYGVEWYKHTMARGRSISNGSLYLVTSFVKCTQWGMTVFDRFCGPEQALTFVSNPLGWKGSGALITKVAGPDQADTPNQCIFLQGYKIMIREDIFNDLPKRQRATRIRGGGETGLSSRIKKMLTGEGSLTRTTMSTVAKSDDVVLQGNFNSSPVHPSDLINAALLTQNPDAKFALTHDDVWCDLLRDNFPTLNYVKLRNIARSYTSTIDEYGCVSLAKISDPVRGTETPGLQESIQYARDEHDPDVFIPARASSTLQPQVASIDASPGDGDEGNLGILVPQAPPTTQEPHKLRDIDVRSKDGKPGISIAPSTLNHSPRKEWGGKLLKLAKTWSRGYRTEVHNAVLAEAFNAPDVMQSNAFFQNADRVNISGNPSFQNNVTNVYGGGTDDLEKLKRFVSFAAQFDSSAQDPDRQCHPGTRQNVLKRLRDWVDNPNTTERIFWLYGPAGAGKSAIAQTIARLYHEGEVAATFFFFRSDPSRNDANRLFTTIPWQLAFSIPGTKAHIVCSLNRRPHLPTSDVETQFDQLVAQPTLLTLREVAPLHVAPVIIIDGIDECTDENLQRRFLKVIGDAVKDDRFPLRFLIVSRPEVHIEHTIRRFQTPILTIDLAKLDDANRDIEKYLVDEFSRIASEQDLDPTWPGPAIIRDIVYKSSGNFIYASVVIRFVGDPYYFAKTQLEIVLNMKPPKTMSPFAALDQLFLGILRRVVDQDFLKRYLPLLNARISVSTDYGDLHKDDAVLMHVSEKELHANLRRMRPLLRFEPRIDVHHRSFLDFLQDSSRSGQYYVGEHGEIRQYLGVFVDSLVRYVSTVIERPDHHNTPHFAPRFREMIKYFPPKIELSGNEWPDVIQPLLDLQDKLLQLPNFVPTWHLLHCNECTTFHLLRDFLYLGRLKGQPIDSTDQWVMNVRKRRGVVFSTTTKRKNMDWKDPDNVLLSLFARLPDVMDNWSPDKQVIKLMKDILDFDSSEIARRICFVSDAQKLVDLLVYLIDEKNTLSKIQPDATRKATLLALDIFARVPIFPPSPSLHGDDKLCQVPWEHEIPLQILSQTIFASRILDRRYIVPIYVVEKGFKVKDGVWLVSDDAGGYVLPMGEWRRCSTPSSVKAVQVMLGLAKAIQYFHSMDIVLHGTFGSNDVFLESLDLALLPKIRCLCSFSRIPLEQSLKAWFSLADNIFSFGCLFYEMFSMVDTKPSFSTEKRRRIISYRPTNIPDYVWHLIQRCCAQGPGSRPTIDEIVQEIESWKIV